MRTELEQALFDRFPTLFGNRDKPMAETCMCWGICTGDGWYDLIWQLCADIEDADPQRQIRFTQVKEKFGELRVYTNLYVDEIESLIEAAEERSVTICELCGAPGERVGNGYIQTLCPAHQAERRR